ncbi:ParA family protein [Oscillochloris sp. ZM17-4]|uniref:ParA family protein n=1 Tax=Oscillochloris sp. ZM17-4 TaxID=2866714 RepID=UPI001C729F9F|nr:ParA family protein [Oscillochloris sp. ZM17-4]MBX0328347.1 ParA family protein [Oscillochloris sp. ZM17-4]
MAHVYAVALEKGGVGKTSIAVNLAAGYAHVGMRTLLIDLDAQRHASRWLGIDTEAITLDHSFAGVALGRRTIPQCVIETVEGVDVIPAHKDMVALPELLGKEIGAGIYVLRDALAQATQTGAAYDIVILDLAPARGPVLATALASATRCIAPVQAVDLVLQSLRDMVETVSRAQAFNPTLRGLSVLRNNYAPRASLDRIYDEGLAKSYGPMLLQTIIPSRAQIRLASGAQQSVFAYRGPDDIAVRELFLTLVEELLDLDGVTR